MKRQNRSAYIAAITTTLALLCAPPARADIFDDVELGELPEAVQKTINEQAVGGKITEIERETEDGTTYYEVDITKDGKRMEFKVSETGKLLTQPMTAVDRAGQKVRDKVSGLIDNDVTLECAMIRGT